MIRVGLAIAAAVMVVAPASAQGQRPIPQSSIVSPMNQQRTAPIDTNSRRGQIVNKVNGQCPRGSSSVNGFQCRIN